MASRDRAATADSTTSVLTFALDGDGYCVETARISSVLGIGDLGVVDDADDPWYAGELAVGGERIRVIDLARVFSTPTTDLERSADPKLLAFGVSDETGAYYGWLVDEVGISRHIAHDRFEATNCGLSFVAGTLSLEGTTYRWLDERAIHEK